MNNSIRLRSAVVSRKDKWPEQLAESGVMFYDGLRITIEEFRKEAIKLGYRFEIKKNEGGINAMD